MHVISLGAGVQSSTMALMAAHGEITPIPDCAIFADTQDEPAAVYSWLDWLEKQLPFPVHRVTAGNLADRACELRRSAEGRVYSKAAIPGHMLSHDGRRSIAMRHCTRDFKIRPILKKVRELLGHRRGGRVYVRQWIGISRDEIVRMKPSQYQWIEHVWPLIDKNMTRQNCLAWMASHGYPTPPRSACVFCPFHSDAEWRRIKTQEPDSFRRAVEFERRYQAAVAQDSNIYSTPYLHGSCQPLDTIDFERDDGQLELWPNECEGMCGV